MTERSLKEGHAKKRKQKATVHQLINPEESNIITKRP